MTRLKSGFSYALAASTLVLGACATSTVAPEAPIDLATDEQRSAAERADPLTRAKFWAGEYEKEPENIETARYFAKSLRGIESHDRAVEVASDTLIIYPGDYEMLMILGRSYLSLNKPDAAAQAFGRAIQSDNSRADAFAALGLAYDKAGQHQFAQRAYGRALQIDPNRTSTLTNYGLSQALSGNIDGAEVALRKAAARPDADMRVRQNLALVLGLQGKFEEMTTVDASAPQDVMRKNAHVLQQMIQSETPKTSEKLASIDGPTASASKESPKPVEVSVPEAVKLERAPVEPVKMAALAEIPKSAPVKSQSKTAKPDENELISAETKPSAKAVQTAKLEPESDDSKKGLPFLRGSLD